MRADDALFVWTPDREPFLDRKVFPLRGKIATTTIPEHALSKPHQCSSGACDTTWDIDDAGRRRILQRLVTQWIHEDNIPVDAVRTAVTAVEEYKDFPFSTEKP